MCSDEQHAAQLALLASIYAKLCESDPLPTEQTIMLSATAPFVVDYRGYKHIFCWVANSLPLTLTLDDLGQFPLAVNEWNNISFPAGTKLYAKGQAATVPVFVRWTNEVIA